MTKTLPVMATCDRCGKPVFLVRTKDGKSTLLDLTITKIRLREGVTVAPGRLGFVAHHCPVAVAIHEAIAHD